MDDEIFYEYKSSQYGDGVLLDEYRSEFSLVAAKRKDGKVPKAEAIKALKFFLEKLEGGTSPPGDTPDDTLGMDAPSDDTWGKDGPSDDDIPF